jgi:multisubunit Na+/H+ antiporter MnhE subunit
MADDTGPRAGSGEPRRRQLELPLARRVGSWVVWWVLLMAFWVWMDDNLGLAELLAGAGAAALGAFGAEAVQYQADTHFRLRIEWLTHALRLPGRLAGDTALVVATLWRRVVGGQEPPSGFRLVPVRYGDETAEGVTRRVLVTAGASFAPNTFVLGMDPDRDVMVVHDLVLPERMRRP